MCRADWRWLTRATRSTETAMQRHTGVSWGVWGSLSPPPSLGPQLSLSLKSQVFRSLPVLRRTPLPWRTHAADGSARPQDGPGFLRGSGGRRCRGWGNSAPVGTAWSPTNLEQNPGQSSYCPEEVPPEMRSQNQYLQRTTKSKFWPQFIGTVPSFPGFREEPWGSSQNQYSLVFPLISVGWGCLKKYDGTQLPEKTWYSGTLPWRTIFFLKAQNTLCINVPLAPPNFYLPLASGDNISNKHPKITNYFYKICIES